MTRRFAPGRLLAPLVLALCALLVPSAVEAAATTGHQLAARPLAIAGASAQPRVQVKAEVEVKAEVAPGEGQSRQETQSRHETQSRQETSPLESDREALATRYGPTARAAIEAMSTSRGFVGIQMLNLTQGLRTYFKVPADVGVLIAEVSADGPAAHAGLRAGDVLLKVADVEVGSSSQIADLVGARVAGEQLLIDYIRDGARAQATVTLDEHQPMVLRLSPSLVRQAARHRGPGRQAGDRGTQEGAFEIEFQSNESGVPLGLDQLQIFLTGEGLIDKMEKIQRLDLREVDQRMRLLESQLLELERQMPENKAAEEKPPKR